MADDAGLDDIAASFVTAAAEGLDFDHPLTLTEQAFAARGVILMRYARLDGAPLVEISASAGMPSDIEMYRHYADADLRTRHCREAPVGKVLHDEQMASAAELRRMPIYREFFQPFDIGRFAGVNLGRVGALDGASTFFAVSKPNTAAAPDQEEARKLLRLAKFARASVRVAALMRRLHRVASPLRQTIEHHSFGVFVLRRNGAIADMNASARAMIRRHDFVAARQGRLFFCDPAAQNGLGAALSADWRLDASAMFTARARSGRAAPAQIVAVNGLGARVGADEDTLTLFVLGVASLLRAPGALAERLSLQGDSALLAQALADGVSSLEIAASMGARVEVIDARLEALCARLGVASVEMARAHFSSAARPS